MHYALSLYLHNPKNGGTREWSQGPGPSKGCLPLSMQEEMQNNVEVVHTYRQHIVNDLNPSNLHLFINAYNRY